MTDWEQFDFVSLRMAALILGVTPGTVSTAVKRGTLRAKRALMSSGGIMFAISTADLKARIQEREEKRQRSAAR